MFVRTLFQPFSRLDSSCDDTYERMSKMKKRLSVFWALLFVFITLASCSSANRSEGGDAVVIKNGESKYSLVIAENALNEIVQSGISLIRAVDKVSGADINLVLDSQSKPDKNGYEILLGETNRNIPDKLRPEKSKDYVIAVDENRVIILGGSTEANVSAVQYFIDNLVARELTLENDFIYKYVYEHTGITLDGKSVTGFDINYYEDMQSQPFEAALLETCNLTGTGSTPLFFEINTDVPEKTLRFYQRDDSLVIAASSRYGLEMADEVLTNEIAKLSKLELTSQEFVDFNYEVSDISELLETGNCYILGNTNKGALDYELGEEMVFTISLYCNGEKVSAPGFFYTIEKDHTDEIIRETVYSDSDTVKIRTSLEKPGFVKIYAAAISENGAEFRGVMPFNGGAAAGFDEISTAYEEPEDFDEFWDTQIKTLDAVLPNATVVNDLSEDYPGYNVYDIVIDAPITPVTGYLSIPKGALPDSLPMLVGLMDYGVFSIEPTCRENTIVFVINPHSIENGREDAYYEGFSSGRLYSYGFSRRENDNPENIYFKDMILRDIQALRYLKGLEEWDGVTIELNGGGQGAYQALAIAAFDKDVSYVYAAYPWLCDIGGPDIGRIAGYYPEYTEALSYYDAVSFANRVACELEIVAGLGDYFSAPSSVAALANSLTNAANIKFYQGVTHKYVPPKLDGYSVVYE